MVVCFLLRIFPHPTFHRTAYAIMAYVGLFTIVAEGCLIFQCVPVQSIWLGWRGDSGAYTCLNVNRMTLVLAVQQILQDLLILGLPVPLLLKLNTSTRKKLSIFFMFSLGIFVVVTSCVVGHWHRLLVLFQEIVANIHGLGSRDCNTSSSWATRKTRRTIIPT